MPKRAAQRSIALRPEHSERPGPGRLTREKISAAALAIADEEGFEALSMRRIAARLGAAPMSLYYYVHTKADLVGLMDDALMGEALVPQGELPREWREAISAIARRTRDMFARHPWALLAMQGAPPGPNAMRHFEQSLKALERAPMGLEDQLALLQLVDDFVFGHSLRSVEAKLWSRGDSSLVRSAEALAQQLFETGAFPRTAALFSRENSRDAAQHRQWLMQDRFERSLAAVLDGAVQRRPRAPRRERPPRSQTPTP